MQESDRSSDTKLRCNWWMTASDLVGGCDMFNLFISDFCL